MPRGNLECIEPRALSLAIIADYLNNLDFREAFELMRRQRIDLNLIYDICPNKFNDNCEKFIKDLNNPNWLSLFLTELRDEDVTCTMYAGCFPNRDNYVIVDKTENICNRIRKILEEKKSNNNDFIQPILISLVKSDKKKTNLEAALDKIKQLLTKEKNNHSAEEALKYLLYMVDINTLYDVALGMYDFELTMFIAQKSIKDPKEYMPFLNNLVELNEHDMKYEINRYLKRYDKALEHVSKIPGKFDECLKFIKIHGLYAKGLKFFNSNSEEYKNIALNYGQYLINVSKYKEAGIMFVKATNYEDALSAFKQAGSWQDVIFAAVKMKMR